MANNPDAAAIVSLTDEQIATVRKMIIDRLNIVKPSAIADAEDEINQFIECGNFARHGLISRFVTT